MQSSDTDGLTERLFAANRNLGAGFVFYTTAYDALRLYGLDYMKLPSYENLTDCYMRGQITALHYFALLSEQLEEALLIAGAQRVSPNVDDVGHG